MAFRGYTVERRVKLFCVTCSFAPDDLFFERVARIIIIRIILHAKFSRLEVDP